MGNDHRLEKWGVGGPGKGQHTHSVHRDTQGEWSHGQGSDTILTHVGVAPTNQIIGLGTSGGCCGCGVSMLWQTHTNTHSDTRDTQDGWSLGQGPDVILTHVRVAPQ